MHAKLEGDREAVLGLPEHKVSRDAAAFLSGLLEKDPRKRTTLGEALDHKVLRAAKQAKVSSQSIG